jgi:hypothetical protein
MSLHKLKTIQPYFNRCWEQEKTFEVRVNDRDFQKGDNVYLQEYDNETNTYSGRELYCTITYVLHEFPAITKGYVVFSFNVIDYINPNNI